MKDRDTSIDILKCLAAIAITNSHMDVLYHPYEQLATGGAIGDVLFFFCSGFTLFYGRMGRFDNWYKKRINRIYPTIFAWAIISSIFFDNNHNMKDILISGGGWFVSCIMLYYIILYFIQKFFMCHLKSVFACVLVITIIWYLFIPQTTGYNMYGDTYFKWCHYFIFMLLGGIIGVTKHSWRIHSKTDSIKLICCVICFYGTLHITWKTPSLECLQILSLVPLAGITLYLYKLCNSSYAKRLYNNTKVKCFIRLIGGLCLEIYLVQGKLLTDKLNNVFPFNILIIFIAIVIVAYIVRCVSRIFSQTFKDQEYNWKSILNPF